MKLYGIDNLYHAFLAGSDVDVSGTSLVSENQALWGGLGVGGLLSWSDDRYALKIVLVPLMISYVRDIRIFSTTDITTFRTTMSIWNVEVPVFAPLDVRRGEPTLRRESAVQAASSAR
ncbi:hypothetical protein M2310_003025 [Rhizobium leguminosarum]|uniref:Uncharacterized protein n=1 Tax=Rhizobium esperanzae TaxID=1967781 RepID=A0A7W6XVY8_9HYPH|nr:hypothetical protein [Rhizobium esperanzae]MDH6202344.1 hypothetical protein [Rhizobium leguminosarum]